MPPEVLVRCVAWLGVLAAFVYCVRKRGNRLGKVMAVASGIVLVAASVILYRAFADWLTPQMMIRR